MLWERTTGLDMAASVSLCERLDGLSLLGLTWAGAGTCRCWSCMT
jgi:hypothetical protein